MTNYDKFKQECDIALNNEEIEVIDYKLLLKIAKAISEEDKDIIMSLKVFYYSNRHSINCYGIGIEDFNNKIKNAVKKTYIYHKNISFGWNDCRIEIPTSDYPKFVDEAIEEKRDKNLYKKIGEKRKTNCQFANIVDYIVQLAEKGRYEKCDGILEDLIRNYDTSSLLTEEEMINDLKTVINGISTDENDEYYIYSDEVHRIADKYNDTIGNIKSTLMVKIRCFDEDYLYRDGFFDLNTEDHQIIERKLKGEPFNDVEPFKMLSEIDLSTL